MRLCLFCTHKSNYKRHFLNPIWAKDLWAPRKQIRTLAPLSFLLCVWLKACPETAPALHHCPELQSQRDDSDVASGTRHPGELQLPHQPALQRILTLKGGRGCLQHVPTWTTQSQTRLINHTNCKEGAGSQQADPTHWRIKEHPSTGTPVSSFLRLLHIFFIYFAIQIKKCSASRLPLLQVPTEPCMSQEMLRFDYFNRYVLFSLPSTHCSFSR